MIRLLNARDTNGDHYRAAERLVQGRRRRCETRRLERQRVSDREAAVCVVPVRRVDDQTVLRRDAFEDRLPGGRSGGAEQRRQAGYLVTLFPATNTSAILRTFEISASGSPSSTTKSAHLPGSSVPRSFSTF